MRKLLLLIATAPIALFGAEKISNFTTATYTEVVKDVNTVVGKSGKQEKAKSGITFSNEDIVKSGRGSRAQLTAPDGTIIRVGPNAAFSLDPTSRAVKLESGTILFYTPPGAGGGRIVTDSVTCAVTGTTITVTMDAKGGFSLQVLEGTVILTNKDGKQLTVTGGQSVSLPIGYTGPMVTKTFTTADAKSAILINGFDAPLPSAAKIVDTIGGLPAATPQQLANGTDTALAADGTTTTTPSTTTVSNTNPTTSETTNVPAVAGQPVIPNLAQTTARDPINPTIVISPNGEGQSN